MLSITEENYLKCIFKLQGIGTAYVQTNAIAAQLEMKAASVTDMIQKLSDKRLLHYEKYKGVILSEIGKRMALRVVRKHRLWETFLVEQLHFNWDEVHEVAEQLEHIESDLLIEKLDAFLNHPTHDPHGDPIPDAEGEIYPITSIALHEMSRGDRGIISQVKDHSKLFLQHLEKIGLMPGVLFEVLDRHEFDQSMLLLIKGEREVQISREVSFQISVRAY